MPVSAPTTDDRITLPFGPPPTPRAGTGDTDFHLALARANASVQPDPPIAPTHAMHVVKAGDTLYGIARAQLAAAGQATNPVASMRHALQLAESNGIRDPNRIHIGQRIDLGSMTASASARTGSTPSSDDRRSLPHTGSARTGVSTWEMHVYEETQRDDTDEIALDTSDLLPVTSSPTIATPIASASIAPSPKVDTAPHAGVALYRQTSAAAQKEAANDVPDIVYKGVVGKVLDQLPIEPAIRTGLQQATAVVGSSIAARSLAALTGLGSPILTLAGLAWGLFSATKIGTPDATTPQSLDQSPFPK